MDGVAQIRRAPYDIEAAIADIQSMGLADDIANAMIMIFRTGQPLASRPAHDELGKLD
jgi:hypothetical protein